MKALPLRRGEIWKEAGPEGVAIYEAETDGLHVLNASALAIWELCDGKTTPEEMALAVAELTGLNVEAAATDVAAALETLEGLNLVG